MKTMNLEKFHTTLKAQGVPREHLAFRCPMCTTVQSAHDLITAGAGADFDSVEKYLGFSCIGRFTDAGSPSSTKGKGIGCNWTLGGLFSTHELEVVTEDGERHPRFEPVSPAEAVAHQLAKA